MTPRPFLAMILSAGLILPPLASAQTQVGHRGMRHGTMNQPGTDQLKDTREMIEDLRIVRMTKELNLTDQQLAKFLPKVREDQAIRHDFFQNRSALVTGIGNLLNSKAPDKELQAKLSDLDKLETDFRAKERESRKAMMSQLSVEQQARLVVFQENFEREMRDLIRGIRQGSPQPGIGPPSAPGPKAP